MDKNLKKIIIAIIIFIIIIIALIILVLKLNNNNPEIENIVPEGDIEEVIDYNAEVLKTVTEKIDYYTVKVCINSYITALDGNNSIYMIGNQIEPTLQRENIYNMLNQDYIDKNEITKENILSKVKMFNDTYYFVPIQMKVLEKENVNRFVTYGIIRTIDNQYVQDMYIITSLDRKNKTFSIEPVDEEINSIDDIKIINENELIENNGYNGYRNQVITNETVSTEYFNTYKVLMLTRPDIAYDWLEENYREKRFGDLSSFENYVTNNKEELSNIRIEQYLVNNYDDYVEYVAKDQNENLYIFNDYYEKDKLEIKLDTYTITTENFASTYKEANEVKKVQMNIDKFFQMINRQDYKTSYSCIAQSFKNNYFATEEEFMQFARERFFLYNKIEFKGVNKRGSNLYVFNIELTDITEKSSETKEVSIIMQLNDNMEFEMSFGME